MVMVSLTRQTRGLHKNRLFIQATAVTFYFLNKCLCYLLIASMLYIWSLTYGRLSVYSKSLVDKSQNSCDEQIHLKATISSQGWGVQTTSHDSHSHLQAAQSHQLTVDLWTVERSFRNTCRHRRTRTLHAE